MRTNYFVFGFDVSGIDLRDNSNFEDFCTKVLPDDHKKTIDKAISEIRTEYCKLGFEDIKVYSKDRFPFDSMELYLELRGKAI